jgi:hypothetical protein
MTAKAGPTEPSNSLLLPPWAPRPDRDDARIGYTRIGYTKGLGEEEAADNFARWALGSGYPRVFGRVTNQGATQYAGAGWVICQGPGHVIVERGRMPLPHVEGFNAEAVAALRGCRPRVARSAQNSRTTYTSAWIA